MAASARLSLVSLLLARLSLVSRSSLGTATENASSRSAMHRMCSSGIKHVCCVDSAFVKTRSNSFHSTLEPNTEVFSKVSRSLAQFTLVNSVSTLLNKGGMSCNCPKASQDFCVNQNKQTSAQLLCSSLVLSRHERSEGRRNSCEAEKAHLLRATHTSSRMPQGHL